LKESGKVQLSSKEECCMGFWNGCIKAYRGLIQLGKAFKHLLLLALRLYWGFVFFMAGWGKLHNIPNVTEFFQSLNIPLPGLNAYIASSIECFGGLLLLIGLGSRLVAIPLAIVMIVALTTVHTGGLQMIWDDPDTFLKELPVSFLMVALIVFAVGPGMFSVDGLLKRFFFNKRQPEKT
jgi:putative oxidoreductase